MHTEFSLMATFTKDLDHVETAYRKAKNWQPKKLDIIVPQIVWSTFYILY